MEVGTPPLLFGGEIVLLLLSIIIMVVIIVRFDSIDSRLFWNGMFVLVVYKQENYGKVNEEVGRERERIPFFAFAGSRILSLCCVCTMMCFCVFVLRLFRIANNA